MAKKATRLLLWTTAIGLFILILFGKLLFSILSHVIYEPIRLDRSYPGIHHLVSYG